MVNWEQCINHIPYYLSGLSRAHLRLYLLLIQLKYRTWHWSRSNDWSCFYRKTGRQTESLYFNAMILKAMPLIWSCIKTKPKNETWYTKENITKSDYLKTYCQKPWLKYMYIVKNSKIPSLVPSRSVLALCPREVWERAGERTPSQYWPNTPDFSTILPLVTFYLFLQLRSGWVSLGDFTAHGRVQNWPHRKRPGTTL